VEVLRVAPTTVQEVVAAHLTLVETELQPLVATEVQANLPALQDQVLLGQVEVEAVLMVVEQPEAAARVVVGTLEQHLVGQEATALLTLVVAEVALRCQQWLANLLEATAAPVL
jgi:hypothetical protein